jgi:hypothetical protein
MSLEQLIAVNTENIKIIGLSGKSSGAVMDFMNGKLANAPIAIWLQPSDKLDQEIPKKFKGELFSSNETEIEKLQLKISQIILFNDNH